MTSESIFTQKKIRRSIFLSTHEELMKWVIYLKNDFLETEEEVNFYTELRKYREKLSVYFFKKNFSDVFSVVKEIEEKINEIKFFTEKIKEQRRGDLIYILDRLER